MKIKTYLTWIIALFSIMAKGQEVDQLINMATEYNPGLNSLDLEYKAALLKVDQVKGWPDPVFNMGVGVLPIETRLGAQRLKFGISQMIPWKGTIKAEKEVLRSAAEVMSNLDEVAEIDIAYKIRSAYSLLQYLQKKRAVLEEKIVVIQALQELAKSSLRSGKGKLSNVLLTERQQLQVEADLALLQRKMEQPTITINRWTGRALNSQIITSENDLGSLNKIAALEYAENSHPYFKVLDQKIQASQKRMNWTRYQEKPQIGVGLDYSVITRRSDMELPNNGRDVIMPMVNISIPLPSGRYDAMRQEETIKQQAIASIREEQLDAYKADIELAYSSIAYQQEVMEKYRTLKKITNESLQLMKSEFAADGSRFEELLKMEMELIDYDLNILESEYEIMLAFSTLYKYN